MPATTRLSIRDRRAGTPLALALQRCVRDAWRRNYPLAELECRAFDLVEAAYAASDALLESAYHEGLSDGHSCVLTHTSVLSGREN